MVRLRQSKSKSKAGYDEEDRQATYQSASCSIKSKRFFKGILKSHHSNNKARPLLSFSVSFSSSFPSLSDDWGDEDEEGEGRNQNINTPAQGMSSLQG